MSDPFRANRQLERSFMKPRFSPDPMSEPKQDELVAACQEWLKQDIFHERGKVISLEYQTTKLAAFVASRIAQALKLERNQHENCIGKAVAQARLEEAEWWSAPSENLSHSSFFCHCEGCKRLAELRQLAEHVENI